jgi:hypothetical protein
VGGRGRRLWGGGVGSVGHLKMIDAQLVEPTLIKKTDSLVELARVECEFRAML